MSEVHTINRTSERVRGGVAGGLPLLLAPALLAAGVWLLKSSDGGAPFTVAGVLVLLAGGLIGAGFYALQPNEAMVLTLFGSYVGTDRSTGLRWVLPWYGRKKISLRVRNVTSETLKVNDKRGNPIEIAANIVHRLAREGLGSGAVRCRRLRHLREYPDRDGPARGGLALLV
jgi:regulator of protease activity HflC (stomatin/prohibitin superfamily)